MLMAKSVSPSPGKFRKNPIDLRHRSTASRNLPWLCRATASSLRDLASIKARRASAVIRANRSPIVSARLASTTRQSFSPNRFV